MVKVIAVVGGLAFFAIGSWVGAEENLPVANEKTKQSAADDARQYSYAIGLEIGSSFHADKVQLDIESLLSGLRDGLKDNNPKYDRETCNQAMQQLSEIRMQSHMTRNEEFLTQNSKAEGVHVLPSGLQYKVLEQGDGPSPKATDRVKTHYRGQLIDGTEFDSSYARNEPATFPVNQVIPGWTEALQKMQVGDKWQLFVPSNLAYGESGAGGVIPPNSALIFEVELISIE